MTSTRIPDIDRRALFKTLSYHLTKSAIAKKHVGLLIIDIRDFKRINRTFGFACGDQVLDDVIHRIRLISPHMECVIRMGNNEFALILPGMDSPAFVGLAVNRVRKEIDSSFRWYDKEFNVDICIGAAVTVGDRLSAQAMVLKSENALQQAKEEGLPFFLDTASDKDIDAFNWKLEKDLLDALAQNQLQLYYQPKISLANGLPLRAEALLRWNSPDHGSVPPDIMIPIIERAGKMTELTKWVLNSALRHLKDWPQTFGQMGVSINVPANIVHERTLRDMVNDALNIWGVKQEHLTLEITESAVIKDQQSSFSNLTHLNEAGIKISIDDFGTGYSSLEYFKNIPAKELKIDKSFVFNMFNDVADKNIVQLVIDLAHKFNLDVVAEGIEDVETLKILQTLGCDFAQGYYISHPISQSDFIKWLEEYDPSQFL